MPVIGRLDRQVEEVLIKPVGQMGRTGEATPADHADAPGRPATGEADAADAATEADRDQTARGDEGGRRPNALPVWLL